MKITADALARAWHRLAAGSPLLDGTPLPPTCASYEEYEARVEDDGFTGLCLVLEDDGTPTAAPTTRSSSPAASTRRCTAWPRKPSAGSTERSTAGPG
ncbi:hypothetical protein [Streptomyces parvulus]|uniref:hypothetical protein n=1 Tax=Streptomyces parvulus TaxID=146923 RepID=UPI0027E15167|nr:hypothetical protein [Streptomyces parvulus]